MVGGGAGGQGRADETELFKGLLGKRIQGGKEKSQPERGSLKIKAKRGQEGALAAVAGKGQLHSGTLRTERGPCQNQEETAC